MSVLRECLRETIYLNKEEKVAALKSKSEAVAAAIEAEKAVFALPEEDLGHVDMPVVVFYHNKKWGWVWGADESALFANFSIDYQKVIE